MSERLYLGIGVSKPELGKQPILSRVIGRPNLQIKIVQTFNLKVIFFLKFSLPDNPDQGVGPVELLSLLDRR